MAEDTNESIVKRVASLVSRASPRVLAAFDSFCNIADDVPDVHPAIAALSIACEVRKATKRKKRRKR